MTQSKVLITSYRTGRKWIIILVHIFIVHNLYMCYIFLSQNINYFKGVFMYCYIPSLTDEQEKILKLIQSTQDCESLGQQFKYIVEILDLSEEKLAYKLLHLCNEKFIVNETHFTESNKLGLLVGSDGFVTIFGGLIILTSIGNGYLKTNNILEQIVKKSINDANLSQENNTMVYNKIWKEVKDTGIDFMVKLTKAFISNP